MVARCGGQLAESGDGCGIALSSYGVKLSMRLSAALSSLFTTEARCALVASTWRLRLCGGRESELVRGG